MSSFFHGYLSDSDDGCNTVKTPIVNKGGANEIDSDFGENLHKLQSEKSDHAIACFENNNETKEVDHIISKTHTELGLNNQASHKIGVRKKNKKKKNKYLNEFLEISSLESVKTLNADSIRRTTQEVKLLDPAPRIGKLSGDRELKQSVNQKRKHQITWLLNEARQIKSEFNSMS
ncbi:uncharacterized protein cubi_00806 [Cryptosporidium ubiquitum]|uniref:Uncharacterized protein n=1 Tax=Cryptosporidium ubiquitum TaxID=857276 RepID=A0A1J4MEH6_9CRYT|nr:uncharacterized protein cubi_00806 [Cryptosporidium ubiquitum]OII71428.1 hypothetical protein cubi_00806 [Cryptosporidium ubiquitum]